MQYNLSKKNVLKSSQKKRRLLNNKKSLIKKMLNFLNEENRSEGVKQGETTSGYSR